MAMGHILDSHDCSLHNRPISTTKLYNPGIVMKLTGFMYMRNLC